MNLVQIKTKLFCWQKKATKSDCFKFHTAKLTNYPQFSEFQ